MAAAQERPYQSEDSCSASVSGSCRTVFNVPAGRSVLVQFVACQVVATGNGEVLEAFLRRRDRNIGHALGQPWERSDDTRTLFNFSQEILLHVPAGDSPEVLLRGIGSFDAACSVAGVSRE
jgi:hypothetical protein